MAPHPRQSDLRYPLTALLGASANLRTLRELFRHGGELSAPALIDRTGLSKAGVRQALAVFEESGVIETLGMGRTRLFRLRKAHPFFRPLSALFKAENERFEKILEAIGDAADGSDGILAVWLYGSVARGGDRTASDLDIAIAAEIGAAERAAEEIREQLSSAEEALAFDASVVAIDTDDMKRLSKEADPWWTELVRDALVIRGERPEWAAARLRKLARAKLA